MRALVTGARGFVGSWLTAHLVEPGTRSSAIDHEVDITDGEAVRAAWSTAAPDVVYHLAALANVGESWADPAEVLRVNAVGTLHVLEAARACTHPPPGPRDQFGRGLRSGPEQLLPVTEDAPLAPVTPYAASKVAAEYLGVQAHLAYGLPVLRMRPFNHVGPGQSSAFVVSALAERIVEARRSGAASIVTGNLTARRDLTDVRDVVRAYRLLASVAWPVRSTTCAAVATWPSPRWPGGCSGWPVSICEFEPDPALARPVDVPVVRGDYAKLHAATGWEPRSASRARCATSSTSGASVPAAVRSPSRRNAATGAPRRAERPVQRVEMELRWFRRLARMSLRSCWRTSRAWAWACLTRSRAGSGRRPSMGSRVASMRPMTCSTASSTSLTRLVTSPRHVAEVALDLAAVGEALLELLAPDLGPLEPEHAQSDHDVGGVLAVLVISSVTSLRSGIRCPSGRDGEVLPANYCTD